MQELHFSSMCLIKLFRNFFAQLLYRSVSCASLCGVCRLFKMPIKNLFTYFNIMNFNDLMFINEAKNDTSCINFYSWMCQLKWMPFFSIAITSSFK
ncbi:hypothetical protein HanHA300_Chr02g0066781 [Helianthus annuus]|nr:hypothetical protein HanHA300_Chr02g0066781 [Helianthus annuus]KAJ0619784.1 hypothetical protein HanHA89_Chr02g0075141 [Helianthus annuus]KAJ0778241.1 hypothetical protein HanLR1_Chr02g0069521 [Helianthus annuus]